MTVDVTDVCGRRSRAAQDWALRWRVPETFSGAWIHAGDLTRLPQHRVNLREENGAREVTWALSHPLLKLPSFLPVSLGAISWALGSFLSVE